nr:hypothetical protein [Tanacetum cinerariifolium]
AEVRRHYGQHNGILAGEGFVQGFLRHAEVGGDVIHAHAFDSIAQKQRAGTASAPAVPLKVVAPAGTTADYATLYAERYITQDKLRRDLTILASDEYEGRETGTKGQKMAAAYISQQFKADSLVAPGTAVQPVFVGYGIEQGSYSDYKGIDVKGKDLIILLGEPRTPEGGPVLSTDGNATKWGVDFRAKAALAAQKGARSVFFVDYSPNSNFAKLMGRLAPRVMQPIIAPAEASGGRAPSFFVSPAVADKLLGTSAAAVEAYEKATATAKAPVANKLKPVKFTISAPQDRSAVGTENVLGFLPGTDKKDEILVVSAHYDHLGIIGGQVYNGADDDGSGTTGMLAIAEAFTKAAHAGHGPRRSILFLANTGEEKGLLGSQYYTEHPVYPLASTITDLNIDMIGRTDAAHEGKPDYVYVIGSDKLSSQL